MPVGMLAGMPAAQVEAILLHELAHVRRFDYLVNLIQMCVESFLFYHPVAWWISSVIRAERENCCDDLAVNLSGDAHEYAAALALLEQTRGMARDAAPAATGGSLVKRIRRLLKPSEGPRAALAPTLSAAILAITAVALLPAWQAKPAEKTSPYTKWLNQDVVYIITAEETAAFQSLQTNEEREQFIKEFWLRRDPTPGTPENEMRNEHYRRIAYAHQRYETPNVAGWQSDRGRIYIKYGPPNEIESHPVGDAPHPYPYEQWLYRFIEGVGTNVIIEFDDKTGTGDYRMSTDPTAKADVVFASLGAGPQASLRVRADRSIVASIPLAFDAKQYSIDGVTRSADGVEYGRLHALRTLCKDPPECGFLSEPVFRQQTTPVKPGMYTFEVTVADTAGSMQKKYSVSFHVK